MGNVLSLGRRGREEGILGAWRRRALAGTWRVASDWMCPEVIDLVERASGRGFILGLEGTVRALGRARAIQGVGSAEAVMDLYAFFEALTVDPPGPLVAAFVEAWAESVERAELGVSCVDPGTGLSTWAHFTSRIYELYAEDLAGASARIIATVRLPVCTPAVAALPWGTQAEIGSAVLGAFTGTTAVLSHVGAIVTALMPRTRTAFARLQDAAERLDRLLPSCGERGCRLDLEPLPAHADAIATLLESLRR
ncbi:hypothetical protein [Sinomonas terrae]|uniref:Uncharacterized protein n=1 Tax=Sinomonas terrae TaxID=2908838 RepID=A0ABS9TXP3_9MICC|nr:hypothetical protein [Sinomonas terrae]MCH6469204.1 hypothetical protein [Sinomonas terrae]